MVKQGGTTLTYLIDGENRRVGKKRNGTLERVWLYQNGLNVVAELDGSGSLKSRFVYGSRSNVPDYMVTVDSTYRLITDQLGSVRRVVNVVSGSTRQRLEYDAWGNVLTDTAPGFQPFGFAGGLYDPDTKLVRFEARDYDASVGRWTARSHPRSRKGRITSTCMWTRIRLTTLIPTVPRRAGSADCPVTTRSLTN